MHTLVCISRWCGAGFVDALTMPARAEPGRQMPIADFLAGAASFAAILAGLLSGSSLRAVGTGIGGFIIMFLYSAAMGAAFPMGVAHLIGASLLGLAGYAVRWGLLPEMSGRMVVGGCLAACVVGGVLVVHLTGERKPIRGLLTAIADQQEERLVHAKAMVRGEANPPEKTEWWALTEACLNATLNTFMAKPYEYAGTVYGYAANYAETGKLDFRDNALHGYGADIAALIKFAFPGDLPRRYELSHMLVQGW